MGLIAKKKEGNTDYKPIEAGVYVARCIGLVDLGEHYLELYDKTVHKIQIIWDIPSETYEKEGLAYTRQISKDYTVSLHEKSNLRKTLDSWRGRPFTEDELKGFDLKNILNVGCQLQVINTEKNGKSYSNIQTVMSLPKGQKVEKTKDLIVFDLDDELALEKINTLPEWIQNKIKSSETYKNIINYKEKDKKPAIVEDDDEFPF